MARHNIYVPEHAELMIEAVGLGKVGWSELFMRGLTLQLATMPPRKVQTAARRVGRQVAQPLMEQLVPPTDG